MTSLEFVLADEIGLGAIEELTTWCLETVPVSGGSLLGIKLGAEPHHNSFENKMYNKVRKTELTTGQIVAWRNNPLIRDFESFMLR